MVDNSSSKKHLRDVVTTLDSVVSHPEIANITKLLSEESLDLYKNLADGHLFVDKEVIADLENIYNKLGPGKALVHTADYYAHSARKADWMNLENKGESAGILAPWWIVTQRRDEYHDLLEYANYFALDKSLNNITTTFSHMVPALTDEINLRDTFKKDPDPASADPDPSYELCDANWKKLKKIWGDRATIFGAGYTESDYEVEVDWKKYVLKNIIKYEAPAPAHDFRFYFWAMEIEPSLVTWTIDLSVNAVYDPSKHKVNNVNVTCNKTFKLNITDWVHTFDRDERMNVFDASKNKTEINKIKDKLKTLYAEERSDIEKNFLEVYLAWNALYTAMNEYEKNEFYNYLVKNKNFNKIYNDLSILKDSEKFAEFKEWFVCDDRKWNKDIKSNEEYLKTISDNIGSFKDFISENLDKYITDNAASLTFVSVCLSKYASIRQKQEAKAAKNIVNDVYSSAKANNMQNKWLVHRNDQNYMRFFSSATTSINGQSVKIDKDQEVSYDMNIAVSEKREIDANFTMNWDRLSLSAKEPSKLVRSIIKNNSVENWIVRAHMCFNVYKAMVQIAKNKNIPLTCKEGGNVITIGLDGDDIVIKSDTTGKVIFHQKNFIVGNGGAAVISALELEQWVEKLWKYFNLAMNNVYKEYHTAVKSRFLLPGSSTKLVPNLPTSFRNSPIKKMLHGKDLKDVTFNTTINTTSGDDVSVSFEKNKFTVNMAWLENPIVSKNLWKILERRDKKGNRIFEWKEREIIQWVYAALIEELRKNPKIGGSDYWVFDDVRKDLYILDKTWELWKVKAANVKLVKSKIITWKDFWTVKNSIMSRLTALTDDEKNEIKKNPILMQRFVKAMKNRLWLRETLRAS